MFLSIQMEEAATTGYTGIALLYENSNDHLIVEWSGITLNQKLKSATETILLALIKGSLLVNSNYR